MCSCRCTITVLVLVPVTCLVTIFTHVSAPVLLSCADPAPFFPSYVPDLVSFYVKVFCSFSCLRSLSLSYASQCCCSCSRSVYDPVPSAVSNILHVIVVASVAVSVNVQC